jgi:cell division cycle 14
MAPSSWAPTPADATEIIPGRLCFLELDLGHDLPKDSQITRYFSIDEDLVYEPYFRDFGPLNLGSIVKYCRLLEEILAKESTRNRLVVHCCSKDPQKRSNAALLICSYQVLVLHKHPCEAFAPLRDAVEPFLPFRDATHEVTSTFDLTILDCLAGLWHAVQHEWFQWDTFNIGSYEHFSRIDVGDMNWVIPHRFLAFSGPHAVPMDDNGYPGLTPEDLVPIFHKIRIGLVVRLNGSEYKRTRFTDQGINHVSLYFRDGTCPTRDIISKFLYITEMERSAVAVHCKAGLGRTGTLIGLYAMKHYAFPARAFIGWNRMCRPGSILGNQQQFLVDMEQEMFQAGAAMRCLLQNWPPAFWSEIETHLSDQVCRLNVEDNEQGYGYEDIGQGERLCDAKRNYLYRKSGENKNITNVDACAVVTDHLKKGARQRPSKVSP